MALTGDVDKRKGVRPQLTKTGCPQPDKQGVPERRFQMKKKERAAVISQESLAAWIFSMWIRTDAAAEARPGQFISMYTEDGTKLLPRPISICEIDREGQALRVVYRVTGPDTGTEQFSRLGAGDGIWLVGPLGNGFPVEKAEGKRAFLMGGGIGVPPILELAKQMKCEKKQIVVGYRMNRLSVG